MSQTVLTIDSVEQLDDGTFAVWGDLVDPTFGGSETWLTGYGDTQADALANLQAQAANQIAHDPADDAAFDAGLMTAPEIPIFTIPVIDLGSGLLGGTSDLLA